jgi:hypothetical protein
MSAADPVEVVLPPSGDSLGPLDGSVAPEFEPIEAPPPEDDVPVADGSQVVSALPTTDELLDFAAATTATMAATASVALSHAAAAASDASHRLTIAAAERVGATHAISAVSAVSGSGPLSGVAASSPWLADALLSLQGWLVDPAALEPGATPQSVGGLLAAWADRPSTRRALWRGSSAALAGYCTGVAVSAVGRTSALWAGTVLVGVHLLRHGGYIEGFHFERLIVDVTAMALHGVTVLVDSVAAAGPSATATVGVSASASALATVEEVSADADDNAPAPAPAPAAEAEDVQDGRDASSGEAGAAVVAAVDAAAVVAGPPPRLRLRLGAAFRSASVLFKRDPPAVTGFAAGFVFGALI